MQVPTHTAREGECLYRRKDIAKKGFSYLSPWQEREEYFFFLLDSAIFPECVWASSLVCWLYLIKVSIYYIFYISPLLSGFFSGSIADQELGFLISVAFLSISARKDFPPMSVAWTYYLTLEGRCRLETCWSHIWVMRGRRENAQALFIWSPYVIKIMDIRGHLKLYIIIKVLCHKTLCDKLPTNLIWISWENCLIQCLLLQFWEIFTIRSPDDVQSGQDVVLSLGMLCESKVCLFLGVWWHKCWLAVPETGLST